MSKKYIEIKTISHGQPRPYADHEYVQILEFRQDDPRTEEFLERNRLPKIRPMYVHREIALATARIYCPYVEKEDPSYNWASRTLLAFVRLDPTPDVEYLPGQARATAPSQDHSDRWRIHVRQAFTD